MRRHLCWLGYLSLVLSAGLAASQDGASLLTATRAALGGDALNAVKSFAVNGSLNRSLDNRTTQFSQELTWEAPDKFVRMTSQATATQGPMGGTSITTYRGFNGDASIFEQVVPSFLPPPPPSPSSATARTPEEIAAARVKRLNGPKHDAVPLLVALFGASFSVYPLEFSAVDGTPNAVDAKGPDGFTWHVFLDPATHLVTRMTWRALPVVTFSSSSTVTMRGGAVVSSTPPSGPPPGDPTIGLADVEWQVVFADYKSDKGLTWPRRMTTTFDGKKNEDMRFGSFKINPKIDPKIFKPRG